jgi:hypothetical protein
VPSTLTDSAAIDAALVSALINDATLAALMPDGVYFGTATAQGAQRFVRVDVFGSGDEYQFGSPAWEWTRYQIKAVALNTSGLAVAQAAKRIYDVLQDVPLAISGYVWMRTQRVGNLIHYNEPDAANTSVRWQHRGAHYIVQAAALDNPGRAGRTSDKG